MSLSSVRKVYNRYSSFYDLIFGPVLSPGRYLCADTVNKIAAPNAKILELGVGTGLSLPLYRKDLYITGIDISEKMLDKAKETVISKDLKNIDLHVMDAENLKFKDNTFDIVVAMYVASVVPDVDMFLEEITRVAKKNAEILFVNHFASEKPIMRFFEDKFAYFSNTVGFNSGFTMDSILNNKKFKLIFTKNINMFGYWKLLHCKLNS